MEKKSSIIKHFGGTNVLDKKVKKSTKYDNIKSSLNTGKTIRDVEMMSDQLVAKKKNEKFKRIKCSTLAKLLQEQNYDESVYNLGNQQESIYNMDQRSQVQSSVGNQRDDDTQSVYTQQTGVSQVSAVTYATEMLGINQNTKFLLLDLRDPEEYSLWRIKESLNFPAPNIARDKTIPELFRFKNQPDKLIIIYLNDERSGTQYAQLFFEKGYENIYLLSGGCESFLEEFSQLCEGRSVPQPKKSPFEESKRDAKLDLTKKKHEHCITQQPQRRY
eukprot:403334708